MGGLRIVFLKTQFGILNVSHILFGNKKEASSPSRLAEIWGGSSCCLSPVPVWSVLLEVFHFLLTTPSEDYCPFLCFRFSFKDLPTGVEKACRIATAHFG